MCLGRDFEGETLCHVLADELRMSLDLDLTERAAENFPAALFVFSVRGD